VANRVGTVVAIERSIRGCADTDGVENEEKGARHRLR
jgi:hypothetical protein